MGAPDKTVLFSFDVYLFDLLCCISGLRQNDVYNTFLEGRLCLPFTVKI